MDTAVDRKRTRRERKRGETATWQARDMRKTRRAQSTNGGDTPRCRVACRVAGEVECETQPECQRPSRTTTTLLPVKRSLFFFSFFSPSLSLSLYLLSVRAANAEMHRAKGGKKRGGKRTRPMAIPKRRGQSTPFSVRLAKETTIQIAPRDKMHGQRARPLTARRKKAISHTCRPFVDTKDHVTGPLGLCRLPCLFISPSFPFCAIPSPFCALFSIVPRATCLGSKGRGSRQEGGGEFFFARRRPFVLTTSVEGKKKRAVRLGPMAWATRKEKTAGRPNAADIAAHALFFSLLTIVFCCPVFFPSVFAHGAKCIRTYVCVCVCVCMPPLSSLSKQDSTVGLVVAQMLEPALGPFL